MSALSHQEISSRCQTKPPLIDPFDDTPLESLCGAKYYLTIGDLVLSRDSAGGSRCSGKLFHEEVEEEREDVEYSLEPSEMVTAYTRETIALPNDVCALINAVNKKARQGLLVLNIGHIDPGWQGPLTVTMVNYGKKSLSLKRGDPIVTITFLGVEPEVDNDYMYPPPSGGKPKYVEALQGIVGAYIPKTFFDVEELIDRKIANSWNEKTKEVLWKELKVLGVVVACLAGLSVIIAALSFWLGLRSSKAEIIIQTSRLKKGMQEQVQAAPDAAETAQVRPPRSESTEVQEPDSEAQSNSGSEDR